MFGQHGKHLPLRARGGRDNSVRAGTDQGQSQEAPWWQNAAIAARPHWNKAKQSFGPKAAEDNAEKGPICHSGSFVVHLVLLCATAALPCSITLSFFFSFFFSLFMCCSALINLFWKEEKGPLVTATFPFHALSWSGAAWGVCLWCG